MDEMTTIILLALVVVVVTNYLTWRRTFTLAYDEGWEQAVLANGVDYWRWHEHRLLDLGWIPRHVYLDVVEHLEAAGEHDRAEHIRAVYRWRGLTARFLECVFWNAQ